MQNNTMTEIAIRDGKGEASSLYATQASRPVPEPGQVLIRVHAAGVNRPDVLQRQGRYPPPKGASQTLGLEVAGEVVNAVGRWKPGDRVCALLAGGGYAEYVAVDARHALPIPDGYSDAQAAGLPETVFTVYANLFEHGQLKPGERLLLHGATSGIGVMAIQMAKAVGAHVLATARGADKAAKALAVGADVAVDTQAGSFVDAATKAGGIDVALDMVGASVFADTLSVLNHGGRIVYIAALGGGTLEVPVFEIMRRQAVLTGSTMRARTADEKARLATLIEKTVWPWIAEGKVKVLIDRSFPIEQAAQAHQYLESGQHVGKVVLTVD